MLIRRRASLPARSCPCSQPAVYAVPAYGLLTDWAVAFGTGNRTRERSLRQDADVRGGASVATPVIQNGRLHVQAGAGVVADSVPAREWE
ncbi:MAG: chorismate-binding protein [Gammaproteobacteria bacterium]|nr:chorismate-binding protein [Gammaproteobacteria bacterium]